MTRVKSPRTLLRRQIKPSDLPIIVRRKRWAILLSCLVMPFLIGLGAIVLWVVTRPDFQAGLLENAVATSFVLLLAIGCITGVDTMFGYQIHIDQEGVTARGLLKTRHFGWDEITHFDAWRNRAYGGDGLIIGLGYRAIIHVDGSNNPKRLLRNLFFAGHFTPPFMELGGKELVKLLTKAKAKLEHTQQQALNDQAQIPTEKRM